VDREFPPDHELIAFFEAEPVVHHPDTPWLYNTLDFTTTRDAIKVYCRIAGANGRLTTCLMLAGLEIAKFELRGAQAFRLDVNKNHETLMVTFAADQSLDKFTLQLKPSVRAALSSVFRQRPST
jgi:hypothetical protein